MPYKVLLEQGHQPFWFRGPVAVAAAALVVSAAGVSRVQSKYCTCTNYMCACPNSVAWFPKGCGLAAVHSPGLGDFLIRVQ